MAKINLPDIAPDQTTIPLDDVDYLVTAMKTTEGLQFMEKHEKALEAGTIDYALMKQVVCKYVSVDGKMITDNDKGVQFDVHFSRKYGRLMRLFKEICDFNFPDFQKPDSEE